MQLSVRRIKRRCRSRLTAHSTTIGTSVHTTRYAAAGRRASKTTLNNNGAGGAETPMTASFDAGNRMTGITLNPNTANTKTYSLSYDANGNLTQKQNTTDAADKTLYTWDADNRLSRIEQGGTNPLTATFSYDAMGRRIQSSITKTGQPTATVQYLYEGAQALGEIRDGKLSHRLLTGLSLDETIARIALTTAGAKDQAASRIFLTDALNSVIAQMSDSDDSTLQTSYAYSPYGASTTVGTDPANNPIQYTSRENDGTGLIYYRARYYDPVLGSRFISEDPIGLRGGPNGYVYVNGDPVGLIDPLGLFDIQIGAGVSAFGLVKGGNLGFTFNFSSNGISMSVQSCAGIGAGAYLGASLALGYSKDTSNKCPDAEAATATSVQFQAEGGTLLAGGAQVDISGGGGQIGVGDRLKGGLGVGGYAAVMGCITKTKGLVSW